MPSVNRDLLEAPAAPTLTAASAFGGVVREIAVEHRWFLGIAGSYIVLGATLLAHYGRPWPIHLISWPVLLAWGLGGALWATLEARRARRRLREVMSARRVGGALLILILGSPFHDIFQSLKQSVGPLIGFPWDERLSVIDVHLHGGRQAWRWLGALYGFPGLLKAFDVAYLAWFLVLLAFIVWAAWSSARRLRQQAVLAFVILWAIGGTVFAAAFASAGPAYQPQYSELTARVSGTIASAAEINLMKLARQGVWLPFGGISAFPSMHVGVSVVVALAAWRRRRTVGAIAWLYAATIQVGSVLLGWHYAIDGYAACLIALASWKIAGALTKTMPPDSTLTTLTEIRAERLPLR